MPSCGLSVRSVRHTTSTWLALCAYEHHIFEPETTHSPSSPRARCT